MASGKFRGAKCAVEEYVKVLQQLSRFFEKQREETAAGGGWYKDTDDSK